MTEEDADPGWVGLTEAIEALRDALVVRQARQLPVSLTHANPSTRLVPSNRTVIQQPPVIVTNGGIRDARIRGYSSIALDSSIIVRPHSADAATG